MKQIQEVQENWFRNTCNICGEMALWRNFKSANLTGLTHSKMNFGHTVVTHRGSKL